jgi:hypothetical protein
MKEGQAALDAITDKILSYRPEKKAKKSAARKKIQQSEKSGSKRLRRAPAAISK